MLNSIITKWILNQNIVAHSDQIDEDVGIVVVVLHFIHEAFQLLILLKNFLYFNNESSYHTKTASMVAIRNNIVHHIRKNASEVFFIETNDYFLNEMSRIVVLFNF